MTERSGTTQPERNHALNGLTGEPFSGAMQPPSFYPGAAREQRLNLLLHLVPLGEALLITGVHGIGKTALLEQFIAKGMASWRICRLDAGAGLDENQLLHALAQTFSPKALAQSDHAERERMLMAQLYALRKSAQQPVLLIDNAHNIPESELQALSKFIVNTPEEEKLLGVVLFGEPEIEVKLNRPGLQTLRSQIKHTFELPLLSEEETHQYLDYRLQAAGFNGDGFFTAAASRAIFSASKGLPLKINELAQAVMGAKHQTPKSAPVAGADDQTGLDVPKKRKKKISFSFVWPFLVAGLLASVLLFQDEINALFNPPPEEAPQALALEHAPPLPLNAASMPAVQTENLEKGSSIEPVRAGVVDESAVQDITVKTVDSIADDVNEATELLIGEAREPTTPPETLSESVAVPLKKREDAVAPSVEVLAKSEARAGVEQAEARNRRWVLTQPARVYTLQVVAQETLQKRELFISRFGLENRVERFSTQKNGQRWYVAAVGVYDSRGEALEASRHLPQGVVPWVRSFGSIQRELWREDVVSDAAQPTKAVVVERAPTPPASEPTITEQERWVLARPPNHFVLQLAAFKQASKTEAFIARYGLIDSAKRVRLLNKGQRWFVAVYGDAADRATARQMAESLVNDKGVGRPWIRSFNSLQQAMQKSYQNSPQ